MILTIAISSLLSIVVYQDFKYKAISWFLIPLLFIGFIGYALIEINTTELFTYFSINIYSIVTSLLGATLIVSIKERRFINILKDRLGLGDVLFFLVLAVALSPINFVVFYYGSILLIGLIYGLMMLVNKKKKTMIPLAGAMGLILMLVLIAEQFIPSIQFYQDFVF